MLSTIAKNDILYLAKANYQKQLNFLTLTVFKQDLGILT